MNATISDMGIVMEMISVERHSPRKKSTTSTTNRRAYRIDSSSELMELRMSSEESYMVSIRISPGRVLSILAISFSRSSQICTVLAPVCLVTIRRTLSRPLVFSSRLRSLIVSRTVARSRTNTCRPSWVTVTTMSLISELSTYSLRTSS